MTASLKDLNASAYQYQLTVQEEFTRICNPLFKLGIKYFQYVKAFPDGRYLMLMNHMGYTKVFLEMITDLGNYFTRQMALIKKDESLYNFLPFNFYHFNNKKDSVLRLLSDFTFGDIFYINKGSNSNFISIYGFGGDRGDLFLSDFFSSNIKILEGFCNYFEEKAAHLISCQDQSKLAYLEQQFIFYKTSEEDILIKKMEEFLRETIIEKRILRTKEKDISLTKREVDCLNCLSLGMEVKEIARTLDLKPKTIQFYLQNLREKSGLKKGALLTSFIKNGSL